MVERNIINKTEFIRQMDWQCAFLQIFRVGVINT